MLFLLIQAGDELYAVDARQVVEVLPLVTWRKLPHFPAGVPGVINLHGKPTPIIDLTEFLFGRASRNRMSTRIIVLDCPGEAGEVRQLGIVTEGVLETMSLQDSDFSSTGLTTSDAPYCETMAVTPQGMIQKLNLRKLLPHDVCERLFSTLDGHATDQH